MEEVFAEPEPMEEVPNLKEFRHAVDTVNEGRDAAVIKMLYLSACRASEICTKTTPWEIAHNKSKPYGKYLSFSFADYEVAKGDVQKILLLKVAVAKRTKKVKDGEDKQRLSFKIVGIPVHPTYEPWVLDLLKWVQNDPQHKLSFDITRMTVQNIVKKNLERFFPKIHAHSLRHFRITHLINEYEFTPYQITAYTGWSLKSTFGAMGVQASSNLDIYAHLQWRDYIQKLLRPIDTLI